MSDPTKPKETPEPINPDDLHDLFVVAPTGEGSDEEDPFAQMRNDPNYAALMRDLEAIASAAKQLFAEQEEEAPSDSLWDKIQSQLPVKGEEEAEPEPTEPEPTEPDEPKS